VAIIGLGQIARSFHLPALETSDRFEVVGVVDPRVNVAAPFPIFESAVELFAATLPDVAVVATPTSLHAANCIELLDAGLKVVCEKSLRSTLADRAILADAERRAELLTCHSHIFRSSLRAGVEAIQAGRLGLIRSVEGQHIGAFPHDWREQDRLGPLVDLGYHFLYLGNFLAHMNPLSVSASRYRSPTLESWNLEAEYTHLVMSCKVAWSSESTLPFRLEVRGTKGVLSITDGDAYLDGVRLIPSDLRPIGSAGRLYEAVARVFDGEVDSAEALSMMSGTQLDAVLAAAGGSLE
jgi:predicted dehydrogenase